jgi:sugar O-acyltransferase (sialic acid O-acetyltransferase NeuD family)
MTAVRTLYLCGAGNSEGVRLALAINRREARWERIVLLDDDPAKLGMQRIGVVVVGPIGALRAADPTCSEAANLVARATKGRRAVRERILASGVPFASLISPDVELEGVSCARDVVVYRHATLGPESTLEEGACVFMGAVVGHEARVGRCCVIAPNAVLNARVVLGEGAYVGSNASILPEITIGAWATVGAGSAVVQDVPDLASAVGVPAEVFSRTPEPAVAATGPAAADEEMESLIAGVWSELLKVAAVGREQNFFDLGGTSLLAIQGRERIRQLTGTELALTDLFRHPTISSLARHLGGGDAAYADASQERGRGRRAAFLRTARARR